MVNLKCLVGMHKPDRTNGQRVAQYFGTHCSGCGKPLRRVAKGRWIVVKETPLPDFRVQPTAHNRHDSTQGGVSDAASQDDQPRPR